MQARARCRRNQVGVVRQHVEMSSREAFSGTVVVRLTLAFGKMHVGVVAWIGGGAGSVSVER